MGALDFLVVPVVAFLLAFVYYGPASQGDTLKRGTVVHDGQEARKDTQRLKKKHGPDILTLAQTQSKGQCKARKRR